MDQVIGRIVQTTTTTTTTTALVDVVDIVEIVKISQITMIFRSMAYRLIATATPPIMMSTPPPSCYHKAV